MNIQGSSIIERRPASRTGSGRWFSIIIPVATVLGVVFILANLYVYFNQKISEADREMLRLRNRLASVEREIDSCRLQYERYSAWPHIRDSIRRFDLPLKQATPAQCRRLTMIPPPLAPRIAITFKDAAALQPTASANSRPTTPAPRNRPVPPRRPVRRLSHN